MARSDTEKQRSRWLAAAVLALGLAAFGWLALGSRGSGALADDAAGDGGLSAVAPPSDEGEADGDARTAGRASVASAGPAKAAVLPRAELRVRVIEADTQRPCPGAIVRWAEIPDGAEEDASYADALAQADQLVAASDAQNVADEGGLVSVPGPIGTLCVTGAHGDLWGWTWIDARAALPVTLALYRDAELCVRVVDAQGVPAIGIDVRLQQPRAFWRVDRLRATTLAPSGIATFRHAGLVYRQTLSEPQTWAATLDFVADPPVEAYFDPERWPDEPLELVLPDSGSCAVRVLDAAGQPYTGRCDVELRVVRADDPPPEADEDPNAVISAAGVVGPEIVFPRVQLGRTLRARVHREESVLPHFAEGPGPTAAGERVSLTAQLGSQSAVLAGRALDRERQPLVDTELQASLVSASLLGSRELSARVRTDGDGRFECDVPIRREGAPRARLELVADGAGAGDATGAVVELPEILPAGPHPLGDVRFEPAPIVAAGRVLGPLDAPVPGAEIQVWLERTGWDGQARWMREWDFDVGAREDGSFAVVAWTDAPRVRLMAVRDGLVGAPFVGAFGERDLVLSLGAEGAIEGRISADSSVALGALQVRARPEGVEDGVHAQDSAVEARVSADGRFRIGGLVPGRYAVEVLTREWGKPVALVERVDVRSGEAARDPRLEPVELGGSLFGLTLRVTDSRGTPVYGADIRYGYSRDGEFQLTEYHRAAADRLSLAWPERTVAIVVEKRGYRSEELPSISLPRSKGPEGTEDTLEIALMPAIPIVVELDPSLPDPPAGYRLQAVLFPEAHYGGSFGLELGYVGSDRRQRWLASSAGRHRVSWYLWGTVDGEWTTEPLQTEETDRIDVADADVEQVITVRYDLAALAAARAALRELDDDPDGD